MIRLRFVESRPPWVVECAGPLVSIGRRHRPPITVVIPDANVARHHCDLVEQDGWLAIYDRNSSGGTYVNDRRVGQGARLGPDDLVGFSGWRFQAERAEAPLTPSPGDLWLLEHPTADLPALCAAVHNCPALAALLVARPDAPPAALEALASCPSRLMQEAVARHPGALPATLRRLVMNYRDAIEQNPSLPLLLLEDPSFAERFRR